MLSKYFLHSVAYLASEKMQEKYMVHATKDNYLLPEELLNDAFSAVERVKIGAEYSLSKPELKAAVEFGKTLERESNLLADDVPWDELVKHNEQWASIRKAAQDCLSKLDFDLEAWEKEELS